MVFQDELDNLALEEGFEVEADSDTSIVWAKDVDGRKFVVQLRVAMGFTWLNLRIQEDEVIHSTTYNLSLMMGNHSDTTNGITTTYPIYTNTTTLYHEIHAFMKSRPVLLDGRNMLR